MKRVIIEKDIIQLKKQGRNVLQIYPEDIITPLAMDAVKLFGINISLVKEKKYSKVENESWKKVCIGSDHTGFTIKSLLLDILISKGFEVIDAGTFNNESCDYPDFAAEVAKNVALKNCDLGIIIDATGIPSAITANKFPGIRAATCYNEFCAKSARSHNNSNILVMGAKTLGEETIKSILDVFLSTKFDGGRHQKRLDKITEIEKYFINKNL